MNFADMKEYVTSLLDIKPGEGKLVGLMFLYNFILLITLYLLKPVRDSLFLVELGSEQLPYVFIFTAFAAIPVSMGYSRFSHRVTLGWVVNGVTFFLAANLVVIWWMLQIDSPILYYIFYIWVSIYSILITSQFWLLANASFNPIQAKRIFTLLSLAAISGSIAGGEITGFLIGTIGISPADLLLIGAIMLLGTVLIVKMIRAEANGSSTEERIDKKDRRSEETGFGKLLFKDILQSRHLMLIIGIIAISVIATTMIDYQFKTVASSVYTTDNRLTTFMGRFYGRVSIIALLLQLFLSSQFISRKGVGGAVTILPSILLLGSTGLFIWPGLIAAVMLRGADQSLKHSLDRTGRELLFVPVALNLKKRTKVFIDLFVDNGAQGLAGALLLLLTFQINLSVKYLSLVVMGLLICWIILAVWVHRSYINEFRESLEKQVSDHPHRTKKLEGKWSLEDTRQRLQSQDEAAVLSALKRLETEYNIEDIPARNLERLLGHPNPKVRKRCLSLFRIREIDGYIQEIARLLGDPNVEVRLEAARYIYHFYDSEKYEGNWQKILKEGLNHQDVKIRTATLGLITKDGGQHERALITSEFLEQCLAYSGEGDKELRVEAARALGVVYDKSQRPILRALLNDSSPEVVKRAILSAGEVGDRMFIHILLDYLDSDRFKKTAQQGLAMYGQRIFGTLYDYLADDKVELEKRVQIPPILYYNASQVALDVLQLGLEESNVPVRHQIIKALNKIRKEIDVPVFNTQKLKRCVYQEAYRYALLKQSYSFLENQSRYSELFKAMDKEIAKSFENIFRLLGLIYNADDIYNGYQGIRSGKEALISESIEFLDNLIDWEEKKYLMPLFESLLSNHNDYGQFEEAIQTSEEATHFLSHLKHPILQELAGNAGNDLE